MALNALTLSRTVGAFGSPFDARVVGATTGLIEIIEEGLPNFSLVNGMVRGENLPLGLSTVVLREYEPGVGYRDSRITVTVANIKTEAEIDLLITTSPVPLIASDRALLKHWLSQISLVLFPSSIPLPALPVIPGVTISQWWADHSPTTVDSNGRLLTADDLAGVAQISAVPGQSAPLVTTDWLGRKCWRFEGSQVAQIADTLALNMRGMAVYMVVRQHAASSIQSLFSLGRVAGTPVTTNAAFLRSDANLGKAASLGCLNGNSNTAANAQKFVLGCQLQLVGAASRLTAGGGIRMRHNENSADFVQQTFDATGFGAEIGRFSQTPGAAGNWARMDVYGIVVTPASVTNAQFDAQGDVLLAAPNIVPLEHEYIAEGDSLTFMGQLGTNYNGKNLGMMMAERLPANWRVVNNAYGGAIIGAAADANSVNSLYARLLATNSLFDPKFRLGGKRIISCQIGFNDNGSSGNSYYTGTSVNTVERADAIYTNLTGFLTHASGWLARGFTVVHAVNIATGNVGAMTAITQLRTKLRSSAGVINATFLSDTQTGAGGTYAGKLLIADLASIARGGATVFATSADAGVDAYFVHPNGTEDGVHPGLAGMQAQFDGGDTPFYGYAYNVLNKVTA